MTRQDDARYFEIARLVRESRNGSEESFRKLLELHRQAIASTLYACGIRLRDTAEDLTQDTALRAWTRLDRLKDPRSFPAWIRRIAANTARDHLRKLAVRRESLAVRRESSLESALDLESSEDPEELAQRASEVRMMLLALSGEDKDVLALLRARAEGVPIAEMARAAGIAEAAMKMRLMRVRQRLRKRLDKLRAPAETAG